QPAMAGLRRLGDAARIGQAVGVGQRALVALTERSVDLVSLDRTRLDTLVEDGVLRAREVESVAGAGEIARLLDRQPAMVEAAAQQRVKRTADLLRVPADRWAAVAEEQGAAKEVGLDAKEYGELLRARIEAAHPARALAGRITPNRRTLASQVNQLKPLLDGEANVLAKPSLTDKDLDGFDARQRQRLRTAHAELRRVHGRFPGLGLDQVLAEDDPDRAVQRVAELTTVARGFLERNEGVLDMDLSTGSDQLKKLDFRDVTAADRPRVVDFARTYQRLMTIAETPEVTEKVAAAGYRSALAVARSGSDRLRRTTDLTVAQADLVHANAVAVAPAVIGSIGSVIERHRDWFGRLPVGNVPIGVDDVLKEMPGYEDFFGSQDYCACDACRSILGPAAYFVDLMRFVEESISEPTFPEAKRDHPLFLGRRRPDLWTLPLTCENTNDLLPTLQIVAEILETYIANEQGFGGDLGDRAAVADFVYRDTLPTAITSFEQPFVLPIHELRSFLGHYSLDLRDIAETTGRERVRASLGLAREAYVELITRRTGLTRLRELYGAPFQLTGSTIRPLDAQLLLRRTTLDRDELGRAVASRFVGRNGTDTITIRGEKRSSESVQNDVERIRGLTRTALDRLRRMTLLARALDWSHDALDVVLEGLGVAELTEATLTGVVRVDRLRRLFDVPIDEAVALVADIPSRPIVHEGVALVDRLFNPSPYDDAPAWPDASIEILLPAFAPD
ncbi:MAG: Tc toxin subunit A, partial [Acidobacteriota bacterium]